MKFELRHFTNSPLGDEWTFLEWGHDVSDSRCQGGAWYYKGCKAAASEELKGYKKMQAASAAAYYAQPWV
jgi:hypothetical protein